MKKRVKGRKFGRKRDQRRALMRHLAEALVERERISTTEARAKELRPYIERIITKSRSQSIATIRQLRRTFGTKATKKLVEDLGPRYKGRPGGYTRIIKRTPRKGDAAKRAIIEFVESKKTQEHENIKTRAKV
ncbi:MAG: 50S ribosomal protein L17 [Candidatus Spechtbacteria bacterium RIFCSPLOWO2_01_FULL_46_10]|uniref:50S ribosomal protein L17 n=1 Tax=Candidatus Spechtbacteria bacterium RIFCSPLOWO2_01_FULL_46_10 TaxID=1802163 RepID=A0A1G2HHL0_9BACT|nr:MAG: 50S ribosomal protein L17 [Candidatus Spechtbacteria bacterium RIFCSPLOWO2_01_FULL_46_10]